MWFCKHRYKRVSVDRRPTQPFETGHGVTWFRTNVHYQKCSKCGKEREVHVERLGLRYFEPGYGKY